MAIVSYITEDERELIRASVVLPMVLSAVENDRKALESEKKSMKRLYITATELLIGRIKAEVARVKRDLWARQIRVLAPNVHETLGYAYATRGLSNRVLMTPEEMKAEIDARLAAFMNQLGEELERR